MEKKEQLSIYKKQFLLVGQATNNGENIKSFLKHAEMPVGFK